MEGGGKSAVAPLPLSLSLCLFPSLSTLERIGFVQVGVVRGSEEGSNDEG